jgi:hypothetical protein
MIFIIKIPTKIMMMNITDESAVPTAYWPVPNFLKTAV